MAMITGLRFGHVNAYFNNVSPRGARRYAPPPPPMAVRLAADLRPSVDGSAVRTPLVAGGG